MNFAKNRAASLGELRRSKQTSKVGCPTCMRSPSKSDTL